MSATTSSHPWRFFRAGGLDQVVLESADDLVHLKDLDQKVWVALSCPIKGLEFDSRTLDLLDTDRDGRIRAPELFAAIEWLSKRLQTLAPVVQKAPHLTLGSVNAGTEEGRILLASAKRVVASVGKPNATLLSLDDLNESRRLLEETALNGDGLIPSHGAEGETRQVVEEIIATTGSATDRSGKPGVSKDHVARFFDDLKGYADWAAGAAAASAGLVDEEMVAALQAVRAKVEDQFARLRLAAFDDRAGEALNRATADYQVLAPKDLGASRSDIESLPLQLVRPDRAVIALSDGINPAWADRIDALRIKVVEKVLGAGKSTLDEKEWKDLQAKTALYEVWLSTKPTSGVDKLGLPRIKAILDGGERANIERLIAKDLALAPEFDGFADVERLLHYQRHFFELLSNFVNFTGFYDPTTPAIFQSGTLYLDQRSCNLCIRVDDPGTHATLATLSRVYVAYCVCTRPSGERMHIAAAFTQGDSDYLMVGRNGVFYDRQGRDWDATIVKVIENPISVRQAFWSPYKRFARIVGDQIEKFAASKDKAITDSAMASALTAQKTAETAKPPAKESAFDVARFAGIFAAIGLAIGAIGGALGAMLTAFTSLAWWQMPLAVAGIMLVISGPSMIIAALKLHQRTLGPLLEGNGWAINGRVRINIPIGTKLTDAKVLPITSSLSLVDPFEDKEAVRLRRYALAAVLAVVVGVAAWFGFVKPKYFGGATQQPGKVAGTMP